MHRLIRLATRQIVKVSFYCTEVSSRGAPTWNSELRHFLSANRTGTRQDDALIVEQRCASAFCKAYRSAMESDRRNMLSCLVSEYGSFSQSAITFPQEPDEKWLAEVVRSMKGAKPPYYYLFRAIGQSEGGIEFLVRFRTDILAWLLKENNAFPVITSEQMIGMKLMNHVLQDLLSIWFSIGLLEVERVTWKSSCVLLEKIAEYESVHPIRSWADLKHRVGAHRRCYVFTHPTMPSLPLVILHVALMKEIPGKISDVISWRDRSATDNEEDMTNVKAAIFYSINSTQRGLQGIDLGHFLIRRVVQRLVSDSPSLTAFSSLSPIPGFRKWLLEQIRLIKGQHEQQRVLPVSSDELKLLLDAVFGESSEKKTWFSDAALRHALRPILMKLCAHYLLRVKHRGYAYDPVGNFHLRNGAEVWRINWEADTSARGIDQSFTMMANYRYFLDRTATLSDKYLTAKHIEANEQVLRLLLPES